MAQTARIVPSSCSCTEGRRATVPPGAFSPSIHLNTILNSQEQNSRPKAQSLGVCVAEEDKEKRTHPIPHRYQTSSRILSIGEVGYDDYVLYNVCCSSDMMIFTFSCYSNYRRPWVVEEEQGQGDLSE